MRLRHHLSELPALYRLSLFLVPSVFYFTLLSFFCGPGDGGHFACGWVQLPRHNNNQGVQRSDVGAHIALSPLEGLSWEAGVPPLCIPGAVRPSSSISSSFQSIDSRDGFPSLQTMFGLVTGSIVR